MLVSEGTAFQADGTANERSWSLGKALHVEGTVEASVAGAEGAGIWANRRRDQRSGRNVAPVGTYGPL